MESLFSYQALMQEDFPSSFFSTAHTFIEQAYRHAYETVYTNLPAEEANDALPSFRRGAVEAALVKAARASLIAVDHKPNEIGNNTHVEVTHGRVVLTTAAVPSPQQVVRPAIYRDNLVTSPQLAFSFVDVASSPKGDFHYGIILHGPSLLDPRRPGFINIGFLDSSGRRYRANFSMRNLYAVSAGASPVDSSEEKIDDKVMPQIRRDIQNNNQQL